MACFSEHFSFNKYDEISKFEISDCEIAASGKNTQFIFEKSVQNCEKRPNMYPKEITRTVCKEAKRVSYVSYVPVEKIEFRNQE